MEQALLGTSITSGISISPSFEESWELIVEQIQGKTVVAMAISCFLLSVLFCFCFFLNCVLLLGVVVLCLVVLLLVVVVLPEGAICLRIEIKEGKACGVFWLKEVV